MNGRILVLLGAVTLFIAAWSGGKQRPIPVLHHGESHVSVERTPVRPVADVAVTPRVLAWEGLAPVVEIPEELVPGRYRVVSDQGDIAVLLVTAAGPSSENVSAIVIQNAGPVRWFFIRLKNSSPAVANEVIQAEQLTADAPLDAATDIVAPGADRATATEWNSKERDILLAQMRSWFFAVNGAVQTRYRSAPVQVPAIPAISATVSAPVSAKVSAPVPATVSVPATIAQLDLQEEGVVPEFNDVAELSDVPDESDLTELPELLNILAP